MSKTPKVKVEAAQFAGLSATEKPIVARVQNLIGEYQQIEKKLSDLAVEIGHALFDLRAVGRLDDNRYSVTLPGKTAPETVGRFDAVINSFGLARATAYRYIRAYENHLKATNPVPSAVTQMATSNGVLDLTTEVAEEALADAYLAAGQPSNPTPQQCMAIVADACQRAEVAPSDAMKEFAKLLSKAIEFAKENNIESEVVHASLESAIVASYGMPEGTTITRELPAIYRRNAQ
jgi:hypothetical protein